MAFSQIHYIVGGNQVANPDGSLPVSNATYEEYESCPHSICLEKKSCGKVDIKSLRLNPSRFHVLVVFRFDKPFHGRQVLIESDYLFALALTGDGTCTELSGAVCSGGVGWRSTDPKYSSTVAFCDWHVGELFYDIDTLYLLLDGKVIGLHGFGAAGCKGVPLSECHKSMYIENLGESKNWGFPAESITGGTSQKVQNATWYYKSSGSSAHSVQGEILDRYLVTGGPTVWGFPINNESSVQGVTVGGPGRNVRMSQFDGYTFYWSPTTGAHEVHGDIRTKYDSLQGGFWVCQPRTKCPIPGGLGRMNGFEGGIITWFDGLTTTSVVTPFQLFLGNLNTVNSEGFLMGQNDLYLNITINAGSTTVFSARYPPSGGTR
jgi:hypothetical protein